MVNDIRDKMKLKLLKLKTKSYLKNKTLRSNLPYSQGVNVGIIFTAEYRQKHDLIKEFIKRLEKDGKKVSVISFLPKKNENYEFLFDFFSDEDVSFWGHINSTSVTNFTETPFDFLFCLDTKPNPLVLSVVARSKAKCCIGKHTEANRPYFELMIASEDDTSNLLESMYKYTRLLN
jgi:hypothetical protein